MINDILDLSKVEAGKMELQLQEFSIAGAILDVQSIVRDMANRKSLDLQIAVQDDLPDIYADQIKFKQIMYNLLSNAVKFTPENGQIKIDAQVNDSEFLISVEDTGIGIDPADHQAIFEEFKQLDSSQSRQYEGTGLGLVLTKKLVELHGGGVWVESEGQGTGSKFSFTLPKREPEGQSHETVSEKLDPTVYTGKNLHDKTILVVEDNPQAAHLLCIYLNEAGYDTIVASDGDEAFSMAKEIKPFAVTLDIMLPNKNGWRVIQEMKNDGETCNIPVIIVSIIDDQKLGFSMGAVDYLVKPVDRNQFNRALDNLELAVNRREFPLNILIIDDKAEDRRLMQKILCSEGFNVLMASSGEQGLDKAIKENPDLIILDLLMPGMNGFDVIKALQEQPKIADIPVIIYTVEKLSIEQENMLKNRVKWIVQKGNDAKSCLMEAIKKVEKFQFNKQ